VAGQFSNFLNLIGQIGKDRTNKTNKTDRTNRMGFFVRRLMDLRACPEFISGMTGSRQSPQDNEKKAGSGNL